MGGFFFQVCPLAFFFFVPVFPSTRPSRGLSASFPSSAPLVKSQWPPFGTVVINIYESRAPRRGLRVTNTVTFQRATVYCVCQEAGEDKGRDYPPLPPPPVSPSNPMKAGRCLAAEAQAGMIPLISALSPKPLQFQAAVWKHTGWNHLYVPVQDVTFPFRRSFPQKLCKCVWVCVWALAWCLFLFIVYTLSGLGLSSLKNTVHYFQSGSDSTENRCSAVCASDRAPLLGVARAELRVAR